MFLRGRTCWMAASVLLMVSLVVSHMVLLLLQLPKNSQQHSLKQGASLFFRSAEPAARLFSPKSGKSASYVVDPVVMGYSSGSKQEDKDPFQPPLYGYESVDEMNDRSERFPTIQERVKVYMSDWYLPPCVDQQQRSGSAIDNDGFVHYRYVDTADRALMVREVKSTTTENEDARIFTLNAETSLGRIHYMVRKQMLPKLCDSEYCIDVIRHWYPAMNRTSQQAGVLYNLPIPVLFQFSDEELSRAHESATSKLQPYPSLPHLKKSRFALVAPLAASQQDCSAVPKPISATVAGRESGSENIPDHLHPIIYKLKTNRHYGMMADIPPQDITWSEKKNQAIFRGTLTGLLPLGSRFSMAYRSSHAAKLSGADAEEKCLELDRCRLVYQVNRFYQTRKGKRLVDAKLVESKLQHTDVPEVINKVEVFGNKMNKKDILQYKVIVMLEGNDAGTGFKWALFSNSVVMTCAVKFTSWALEELLEPWVHFIPLDPNNFEQDVHAKMQWVIDNDAEAQEIARRGSLWIRDLLQHPDAAPDDNAISDDMVRRYQAHFVHDDAVE